jgi:hypothetical protein
MGEVGVNKHEGGYQVRVGNGTLVVTDNEMTELVQALGPVMPKSTLTEQIRQALASNGLGGGQVVKAVILDL